MVEDTMGLMEFTGLKDLEPLEQTIVKGISQEYFPILQKKVHNDIDVLVHVKSYGKGGKQSKYSVHVKLIYAGNVLDVNKVSDWDLPRGVHEAFVALLNIAKKKFKENADTYNVRRSQNKSEKSARRREREVRNNKRKSSIRREAQKKRNRTY